MTTLILHHKQCHVSKADARAGEPKPNTHVGQGYKTHIFACVSQVLAKGAPFVYPLPLILLRWGQNTVHIDALLNILSQCAVCSNQLGPTTLIKKQTLTN